MTPSNICKLIVVLSVIGILISGYALLHNKAFVSGSFCTLNENFNCDIVNRGPYSEVLGVPVALVGVAGYAFLLGAALLRLAHPTDTTLAIFLASASLCAVAFTLYLTYLEAFVLRTWCILCLTSQVSILIIFGLSVFLVRQDRKTA